ncbi:MAG: diguanylate cyclase response regulator [Rhodospirillaceae bacterium]|nr:MAG: diguanylate cyclase response regulator [Rhodospirillaceae bacterium]
MSENRPKILIVDDDPDIRDLLNLQLALEDYDIIEAENGKAAIEKIISDKPQLMIIDIMMPVMDGYEACLKIRADPELAALYIIILSAKGEIKDKVSGLDTGADAYLSKPFNPEELKAQVRAGLRTAGDRHQAMYDALTNLFNRKSFNDLLLREVAMFKRDGQDLSMVMIDIDHFKNVNDSYGHDGGDKVLIDLAKVLRTVSRPRDLPCRWGGEEFAWLLPETNLEQATIAAERLRQAIQDHDFQGVSPQTVSLGVSMFRSGENDGEALCKRADKALYAAKQAGRNRVESS